MSGIFHVSPQSLSNAQEPFNPFGQEELLLLAPLGCSRTDALGRHVFFIASLASCVAIDSRFGDLNQQTRWSFIEGLLATDKRRESDASSQLGEKVGGTGLP